jgi:hypothetical protein
VELPTDELRMRPGNAMAMAGNCPVLTGWPWNFTFSGEEAGLFRVVAFTRRTR